MKAINNPIDVIKEYFLFINRLDMLGKEESLLSKIRYFADNDERNKLVSEYNEISKICEIYICKLMVQKKLYHIKVEGKNLTDVNYNNDNGFVFLDQECKDNIDNDPDYCNEYEIEDNIQTLSTLLLM